MTMEISQQGNKTNEPDVHQGLGHAISFLYRQRRMFMEEALREYGLQGVMHMIMAGIYNHPGTSQDKLAELYALDKGTIARGAQKLENMEYITRCLRADNRRQYHLNLTEKGFEVMQAILRAYDEWGEYIARDLSDDELVQVLVLLDRMKERYC